MRIGVAAGVGVGVRKTARRAGGDIQHLWLGLGKAWLGLGKVWLG